MPLKRMLTDLYEASDLIATYADGMTRPIIVALDGRSGAGKSTLARELADRLDAAVIEGDDFYAGGIRLRTDSPETRANSCIDWTRQRQVLETLRVGRNAVWRRFDWEAFDGRLCDKQITVAPKQIAIIEGVYAARPELGSLVDLRILLSVSDEVRMSRLASREAIGPWERQWHEAEDFYFQKVMPPDAFDAIFDYPTHSAK